MENIRTVLCDLPNHIKGFTVASDDNYYTIVLNENLTHETNLETYYHELYHIHNNDFDKKSPVGLIEIMAHK